MIYQVRANLFIKDEKLARAAFLSMKGYYTKAISINPGKDNAEFSEVQLIENRHDTNPTEPCTLLLEVRTKNEVDA